MTRCRVIVHDQRQPALTSDRGERYDSPPQPESEALVLVRLLLGVCRLPDPHGPWQQAIPGGKRHIWLEPDGDR
jgi:hypothetical protein